MGSVIWILERIVSAVVSYFGPKVFDELVGANGQSQVADLSGLSIHQIRQAIGAAFRDHDVAEARAAIDSVVTMMHEFNQAPGQVDRLENATAINTQLVARLMNLGPDGTSLFLIAAFAHIAILQARFTTFGAEGERSNARDAINSFSAFTRIRLESYWADYVSLSVSPVVGAQINTHVEDPDAPYYYTFQVNGADHGHWTDPGQAERARVGYINTGTPYGAVERALADYPNLLASVDTWH